MEPGPQGQAPGPQGQQPGHGGAPTPSQAGAPTQGTPQPGAAAAAQQAAAQAMAAAAKALEGLGKGLGEAAAKAPQGAEGQVPAPGKMAEAQQAATAAAQSESGMAAAKAAGDMAQMAAAAAAQAQAVGGSLTNQPHPQSGGQPSHGTGEQATDLSAARLKSLGIKLGDWARLPGELRNQILQAAQHAGPAAYRPLIKRYFQEIARRGGAKQPKGKAK